MKEIYIITNCVTVLSVRESVHRFYFTFFFHRYREVSLHNTGSSETTWWGFCQFKYLGVEVTDKERDGAVSLSLFTGSEVVKKVKPYI